MRKLKMKSIPILVMSLICGITAQAQLGQGDCNTTCNLVPNESFNNFTPPSSTTSGVFELNLGGNVQCWTAARRTPDLVYTPNSSHLRVRDGEFVTTLLSQPLIPNRVYFLNFTAQMRNGGTGTPSIGAWVGQDLNNFPSNGEGDPTTLVGGLQSIYGNTNLPINTLTPRRNLRCFTATAPSNILLMGSMQNESDVNANWTELLNVQVMRLVDAGPDICGPGNIGYLDCLGRLPLATSPGQPGATYSWTPATGLTTFGNNPRAFANPTQTTQYILNATFVNTDGTAPCTDSDTVIVFVPESAEFEPRPVVCTGDQQCYTPDNVSPGTQYDWTILDDQMQILATENDPNVNTLCFTFNTAGVYFVQHSVTNPCGTQTHTESIVVERNPVMSLGPDRTICEGQSATLFATTLNADFMGTYEWEVNNGGWQTISTNPSVTVSPTESTRYRLTVDNQGCATTDNILVRVDQDINIEDFLILCSDANNGIRLEHDGPGSYTYEWFVGLQNDPTTFLNLPFSTDRIPRVQPAQTTVYTVRATSPNGCIFTDDVEVRVGLDPVITINQTDINCDCKELEAVVTGEEPFDYRWDDTYPTDEQVVTVCPPYGRDYELTVEDANGCETTTTVFVGGWADDLIDEVHFLMEPSSAGPYTDYAQPEKYIQQQVIAPDCTANDHFGGVVVIDGDYAAVSTEEDYIYNRMPYIGTGTNPDDKNVYILHRNSSLETWSKVQILTTPGASHELFGKALSMDGNTLAVADNHHVYLYQGHPANLAETITFTGTVYSIDLQGNELVVGVDGLNGEGEVWYYPNAVSSPTTRQALIVPGVTPTNKYGYSVAISEDRIVVGAPDSDGGQITELSLSNAPEIGVAHLFQYDGVNTWNYESILLPDNTFWSLIELNFGYDVDIDGEDVIVGAPHFGAAPPTSGYAFIFTDGDGDEDIDDQATVVTSTNAVTPGYFGYSVALSNGVALVGAPINLNNNTTYPRTTGYGFDQAMGRVSAFFKQATGWGINAFQPERVEIVAYDRDEYDFFGYDVAVSGEYALCGAPGQNTPVNGYRYDLEDYTDNSGSNDPFRNTGSVYFSRFTCVQELQSIHGNSGDPTDPVCNNPGIYGLKDFDFLNLGAYDPTDIYALGGNACGLTQSAFERGASTIDPATGEYFYTLGTSLFIMDNEGCYNTELTLPALENYTSLKEPEFDPNTGHVWVLAQFAGGYDLIEVSVGGIIAGGNQPMNILNRISLGTNAARAGSSTFDPVNQLYYYVLTPAQFANNNGNIILGTIVEVDVANATYRTFNVKDMDGVSHTLGQDQGDIISGGGTYRIHELEYNVQTGNIVAVAQHYEAQEKEIITLPGGMGGGGEIDNPNQPVRIRTIDVAFPVIDVIRFNVPGGSTANAHIVVEDVSFDGYTSSTFDDQHQVYYLTATGGSLIYVVDVASESFTTQQGTFTDPKNKPNIFEIEHIQCAPASTGARAANTDEGDTRPQEVFEASAFPNPNSHGRFDVVVEATNMEVETIHLQVVDMMGKVVEEQQNAPLNAKVDISGYAKGIYFLRVTVGEETQIKKLIFQ